MNDTSFKSLKLNTVISNKIEVINTIRDKSFVIMDEIDNMINPTTSDLNYPKDNAISIPNYQLVYKFATDMNWQESFRKSNGKGYRGKYEPSLENAMIISANFNDFKNWMNNNYKLR